MRLLGTYAEFKKFVKKTDINSKLDDAIKIYLESGGVLKVRKKLPLKILYPGKIKLRQQFDIASKKEKYVGDQIKQWKSEMNKMTADGLFGNFTRVVNPIYWQHLMQIASNQEYRKSFEIVDPPIELMNKQRYKKVIEMFVKNSEYRERLVEARTSILGKMRDSIKETAYKSGEFKKETIRVRLEKLHVEKELHGTRARALRIMMENSGQFF